ncbi:c-type cytochrome biogenesis protein CcsB [Desulfopila inferna]|uniref:c-type cytochrome biogenesis protein CcsB n=1 Tax=Desulfopila inferna TaxID=468528 RepID=UPI00196472C1|nr:c-type cytochrome biogenesis protein CcsB [Desulfopila inferna]MBM9603144.1 c-type cytochrome biogenesis protein CcsB [Desulfopila inferna]
MDSSTFLGITTFTYLFSSILYAIVFIFKVQKLGKIATWFTALALIIQTFGIGLRWHESYELGIGHAPLTNMYESVVFFAWTIVALYLFIEWKFKARVIGVFTVPLAFLAMAYASMSNDISKSISPLVPALQSNWLIAHVVTCFIGYAAFAVAAALGVMYLLKNRSSSPIESHPQGLMASLPPLQVIDTITHKMMVFGFIWLTAGIITGAVWANSAWGTYWSWDPKETWSLITWFVYAITLHARYTRGWGGTRIAWLAIVGFIAVIFTYYGVNFLLSGLHSYGSS